jgi:RimJ/RimL family protein N-acetyltransferase
MQVPDSLVTERLHLRLFTAADAPFVVDLVSDPAIAAGVLELPFPYTLADALEWICHLEEGRERGREYAFAVSERERGTLAGAASLRINCEHSHAELGYWIGRDFRGKGYAREAASALLEFGFFGLGLHRIYARHLAWNTASARVLTGIGLTHEGTMRGHALKWGSFHDIEVYGICIDEYYRKHAAGKKKRGVGPKGGS